MIKKLFSIMLCAILASPAFAATWYTSPLGSDANACTSTSVPCLTISHALSLASTGDTIAIRSDGSGTYTITAPISIAAALANITLQGFQTTLGDYGTCPLITTATNSTELIQTNSVGGVQLFQNLCLSNTAGTRAAGLVQLTNNNSTETWTLVDVKMDGFTRAIANDDAGAHDYVQFVNLAGPKGKCEIKNSGDYAVHIYAGSAGTTTINGCWIHGLSNASGVFVYSISNNAKIFISNSVISDSSATGVFGAEVNTGTAVLDNVAVTNITGTSSLGVYLSNTATTSFRMTNSIVYGNTENIHVASSSASFLASLASSSNNATDGLNTNWPGAVGDVTLSASPFVNEGAGNFALNTTSGGGAALRAAGLPGIVQFGTGYADIGPLQSQGSAGTGTTTAVYGQ
jgi:hypothetical protein